MVLPRLNDRQRADTPPLAIIILWILSFVVYYFDVFVFKWDGIDFRHFMRRSVFMPMLSNVLLVVSTIIVIAWTMGKLRQGERNEVYWFAAFMACVFVLLLSGLDAPRIMHLVLAFLFLLIFYRSVDDKTTLLMWATIAIFIDFIGYQLLAVILGRPDIISRVLFPIWPFAILIYGAMSNDDVAVKVLVIIQVMVFLLIGADGFSIAVGNDAMLDRTTFNAGMTKIENFLVSIPTSVDQIMGHAINETVGITDIYQGREEQTGESEKLGVRFEDMEADMNSYYAGDPVAAWVWLKARALNKYEHFTISLRCSATDEEGNSILGTISPESEFEIYTLEDHYISCEFPSMDAGFYDIQINATFDFTTTADITAYYMNQEAMNSLKMEGKDLFAEYPILEDSVAEYTQGPVMLGMEVQDVPIAVPDDGRQIKHYIGTTVGNSWDGVISSLDAFSIFIPNDMSLDCRGFSGPRGGEDRQSEYARQDTQSYGEILDHLSFRCWVLMSKADLDNSPVTSRVFETEANYHYTISDSIHVTVEELDEEA